MQDAMIATACAQEGAIPSNGANTALMATHGLHKLVLSGVPNLELTSVSSDGKETTISGPLN